MGHVPSLVGAGLRLMAQPGLCGTPCPLVPGQWRTRVPLLGDLRVQKREVRRHWATARHRGGDLVVGSAFALLPKSLFGFILFAYAGIPTRPLDAADQGSTGKVQSALEPRLGPRGRPKPLRLPVPFHVDRERPCPALQPGYSSGLSLHWDVANLLPPMPLFQ